MAFSLEQIDAYIDALLLNAASLIREAQILYDNSANSRAFALAHLAREEIAKTLMLQAAGTRMLAGHSVDFKDLERRLRDHKQKLIAETINSIVFCAGVDLNAAEDMIKSAGSAPDFRNDLKNNSLYVGFKNGTISQPAEQFTASRALRTITLASDALTNQASILKLLGPFATRGPIKIPEIDPENVKFDREAIEALGAIYTAALLRSKDQKITDQPED
ncbi:AbiV family abortive infection protein [Pseudomonas sp. PCH44]|uniref:AbiV family abortive infection protein n=1 Tax=Pseudomonas sp. PCH44 TaxID=2800904 RepID=UPI001BAEC28C|nr:AbiV family abortive infection protein [Pseudomonas sp. PCH44]MBS3183773.1 AbiV family abortive infection protein [Pseudomonas sp. PCH44]